MTIISPSPTAAAAPVQDVRIRNGQSTIVLTTRIGPGFITAPTFEFMRFPAGESHLKVVNDDQLGQRTEIARVYGHDDANIATLAMWADAVHQRGDKSVLLMPYLPGARADRGLPFGAKVYATLLNALNLDQVITFDPHSPIMPDLINNLTVIDSAAVIRKHVIGRADSDEHAQKFVGVIAPDAGAATRTRRVADAVHLPMFQALKHRDERTGALSGFTCEDLPETGRLLIVDDICDGGGTFAGLAVATGLPRERLALYVSHGVFSTRAKKIERQFADVYTTNSFRPADPANDNFQPATAANTINIDTYLTGAIK